MTSDPHPVDNSVHDHVRGPEGAPVTVLFYGDYECPYSLQAVRLLEGAHRALEGAFRLRYRHFPLTDAHEFALVAARAAEAAGLQGAFWGMHDALYAHAWALEPEAIRGYAANLGLELDRFERDLAGGAVLRRVREQRVSGHHLGVDATPTLFINNVRYTGALRSGALEGAIEGQR